MCFEYVKPAAKVIPVDVSYMRLGIVFHCGEGYTALGRFGVQQQKHVEIVVL